MHRVLQGDCLELFKDVADNSIDVAFADPPFNLEKKYKSCKDNLQQEKYLEWCYQWLDEMVRVVKPTGSIFVHNIPKWLVYYSGHLSRRATFRHWIAWDAPTMPMGKTLQPSHYGILFYTKTDKSKIYELRHPAKRCRRCHCVSKDYGGKKYALPPFGPLVSDVWTDIHRCKHNKYRDEHPCQLPITLLERIILMSSDEGDTILDPFTGTGTTGIAAKRLGRNYLGFELSPEYRDIADRKIKSEETQSKIEDIWVSCFLNNIATVRDLDSKTETFQSFFDWPQNREQIIELAAHRMQFKPHVKERLKNICR